MGTQVQLPDGNIGEFPDGMDSAAIEAVLQKQFPSQRAVQSPISPPSVPRPQVNMQPESGSGFVNRITGHPDFQPTPLSTVGKRVLMNTGRDVYNLSPVNLASMATRHFTGKPIPHVPAATPQELTDSARNIGLAAITAEPEMEIGESAIEQVKPARIPMWKRAGIEAGRPASSVDTTPYAPYKPTRSPAKLIEQVKTAKDVTPALTGKRPGYYDTDEQAWQRYPKPGSSQDVAEPRTLQEQIRDQAHAEQRGRLSRSAEQGYAENTRSRTPKGELTKQFRARSSGGARLIDQIKAQSAGEDLTPILNESLRRVLGQVE
jgi:hypothetical protein